MTCPAEPRPFVVLWRVMDQCNLSCPFCAYDKRLAFPRSAVEVAEVARMIDLLADWQESAGRPVVLSWLGGEPTLWPAFEDMTARAAAAGLTQSLTTNGTTLGSPRIRRALVERFAEVTISVDAIGQQHEEMRGWKGGYGKLSRWVPALSREIAEAGAGPKLRANVVLMHQTIGDFDVLCDQLVSWGTEEITFNQLGGRDRPEFYPGHRLSPEDVAAFKASLPALRARMRLQGVTVLGGEAYVERIVESAADAAMPIRSCGVAKDFLFIDEQCRVAPCAFVEGYFGISTRQLRSVEDMAAISGQICAAQAEKPAEVCANCMSTQQFSKFAA